MLTLRAQAAVKLWGAEHLAPPTPLHSSPLPPLPHTDRTGAALLAHAEVTLV